MSERRKITVVGAGNVGATCAQVLATRDYADVVLVDIKEGLPQGKALDINQMGAVLGFEPNVTGSNGYEETAGSDVVVITAGLPRSPGMSRDDLVTTNEKIVRHVTEKVDRPEPRRDPHRRLEPARRDVPRREERLRLAEGARLRHGRHPRHRALLARSSRGRPARPVKDVQAMVLGGHGDQMVPVVSATTVGGVPLRKLVAEDADPGDGRAHREGRRRAREPAWAPRPGTRRARPPRRWSTRSCSTRSASSRARRTSRASTASTASTWACR